MSRVRPFWWPPSLLLRQAASAAAYAYLARWKKAHKWLVQDAMKTVPVSAGALGMGCIGFPAHPAWEVTVACNLQCLHCHASAGKPAPDELDTAAGKELLNQLAKVREFRMLVFTGGEPLVRRDILELLAHSGELGFKNVIATNATLIDKGLARELRRVGVVGAAVSLDGPDPELHNMVRQSPTAYEKALAGIEALAAAGILIQVNITAMEYNRDRLRELLRFADELGASIVLMYQLVPVGRGEDIADAALGRSENESLLKMLAEIQRELRAVVEPVAGPQYWAFLMEKSGLTHPLFLKAASHLFHGCTAGRGFVYIKPNGDVWPCPFVGVNCGNVLEQGFDRIWRSSKVLEDLRRREERLKGHCGSCRYRSICGGCRGRAWAATGDYLAEDPSCFLRQRDKA